MKTTCSPRFTLFICLVICWILVLSYVGCNKETHALYFHSSSFPSNDTKIRYFIAANLMNSEDIFPQFCNEIVHLATMLERTSNVFISIYENGSKDNTKVWLRLLSTKLRTKSIAHRIICDSEAFSSNLDSIRRLALVRDKALTPLFLFNSTNQLQQQTKIIFLNDIYLNSLEIYRLVKTREENYDWVCGLDFYRGFYDRFVSRDVHGGIFSRWYPYIREEGTKRFLIRQVPVPVRACWNGAAVFLAQPVVQYNLTFVGLLNNESGKFCSNPRSECHLLVLSFRKYNYSSIWVNPNVLISYDSVHLELQQFIHQHFRPFFGLFNDILMKWFKFQRPELHPRDKHDNDDDDDACPQLPMLCC